MLVDLLYIVYRICCFQGDSQVIKWSTERIYFYFLSFSAICNTCQTTTLLFKVETPPIYATLQTCSSFPHFIWFFFFFLRALYQSWVVYFSVTYLSSTDVKCLCCLVMVGRSYLQIGLNRRCFNPIERSPGFDPKYVEKASLVTQTDWGDLFQLQYHLQKSCI